MLIYGLVYLDLYVPISITVSRACAQIVQRTEFVIMYSNAIHRSTPYLHSGTVSWTIWMGSRARWCGRPRATDVTDDVSCRQTQLYMDRGVGRKCHVIGYIKIHYVNSSNSMQAYIFQYA
jgi:hypothetical protein